MNNKFVYCLDCEAHFEFVIHPELGEIHGISIPILNDEGEVVGADRDLCYFPAGYTYSPPPETELDWIDHVTPPGDDEVLVIDLQALEMVGV